MLHSCLLAGLWIRTEICSSPNPPSDFWEVRAGCLLRRHVVPRRSTVDVNAFNFKDASDHCDETAQRPD
jgi:hypothetical protein